MNHIYVMPRVKFISELKSLSEQQFVAGAFISIHDPGNNTIIEDSSNVLNLWFHDSDEETFLEGEVLFDIDMAQRIHKFVEENKDAKFWMIHCTAGKCRSGAVGEVLSDYFEIPWNMFKRDNPQIQPNIYVKLLLRKSFAI